MTFKQKVKNVIKHFIPNSIYISGRNHDHIVHSLKLLEKKVELLEKNIAILVNNSEKNTLAKMEQARHEAINKINRLERIDKLDLFRLKANIAFMNPLSLPVIKVFREQKLTISLTTFPERDFEVDVVIYSLLMQSILPDRIILWLSKEEYPNKEIPHYLEKLKQYGIEIYFCENTHSYKKLIPLLEKYPEDIIVTADDDIFYNTNWLKLLYESYLENPQYVHAHRSHKILFDNEKKVVPYKSWKNCIDFTETSPSYLNFCTTGGGVLYPPGCFYKDIGNKDLFLKLCPLADDIWFWTQLVLQGVKINVVNNNHKTINDLGFTETYPKLWDINGGQNKNDEQIKNILEYYPEVLQRLKEELNIEVGNV